MYRLLDSVKLFTHFKNKLPNEEGPAHHLLLFLMLTKQQQSLLVQRNLVMRQDTIHRRRKTGNSTLALADKDFASIISNKTRYHKMGVRAVRNKNHMAQEKENTLKGLYRYYSYVQSNVQSLLLTSPTNIQQHAQELTAIFMRVIVLLYNSDCKRYLFYFMSYLFEQNSNLVLKKFATSHLNNHDFSSQRYY